MFASKEAPKGSNGNFIVRIMHEDKGIRPLFIIDHKTAGADLPIWRSIDNFTSKDKNPKATLVVSYLNRWLIDITTLGIGKMNLIKNTCNYDKY